MTPRGWNSTLPVRRERPRRSRTAPMAGKGAAVLHPGPFRSEALRQLAAKCPRCTSCGIWCLGRCMPCHSNELDHGKGMGLKSPDIMAFMCSDCHDLVDGRTGNLSRSEKVLKFLDAVYKTFVWLFEEQHLQVVA